MYKVLHRFFACTVSKIMVEAGAHLLQEYLHHGLVTDLTACDLYASE